MDLPAPPCLCPSPPCGHPSPGPGPPRGGRNGGNRLEDHRNHLPDTRGAHSLPTRPPRHLAGCGRGQGTHCWEAPSPTPQCRKPLHSRPALCAWSPRRGRGVGGCTAGGPHGKGHVRGGASSPGPTRNAGRSGETFPSTRRTERTARGLGWPWKELDLKQGAAGRFSMQQKPPTLRPQAVSKGSETGGPPRWEAGVLLPA